MIRVFCCLFALLLTGSSVFAQIGSGDPDLRQAQSLFERWLQEQQSRCERTSRLVFKEQLERLVDGPHGSRVTAAELRVSGKPCSRTWDRSVLSLLVDGRPTNPDEYFRGSDNRRGMMDAHHQMLTYLSTIPAELFERMTASRTITNEPLRGQPSRRLQVVPTDDDSVFERVTLWFAPNQNRLLRSQAIYSVLEESPIIVNTDYERYQGLDVPRRLRCEGTVRHERRLRTFTILFRMSADYSDYSTR